MFDLVIRTGTLIDATRPPRCRAALGPQNDRIRRTRALAAAPPPTRARDRPSSKAFPG